MEMENKEKLYKIYYGDNKDDYIQRYLKDSDIINGYLSEAKAFNLFFDNMILCNNIFNNRDFSGIDILIDAYNEEEECYIDEFQHFIVDFSFSEVTITAVKKMRNTLYYLTDLDLYVMGVTDLGTHRSMVSTDLKVEEVEE